MSDPLNGSSVASDDEALRQGATGVDLWLSKIRKARKDEEKWRTAASDAIRLFEADEDADVAFNLFFSNIETLVPALYNSTPVPDVRVRYAENDPVGRLGSETIARLISCSLDKYDFDDVMTAAVQDAVLAGRGVVRVRFSAETQPIQDEDTADVVGEMQTNERCWTEIVPWDRFVQGPALVWSDVPWIAFQHDLNEAALRKLLGDDSDAEARIEKLGLAGSAKAQDEAKDEKEPEKASGVYHTVPAYEVFDRETRRLIWITERDTSRPLKVIGDPFGLADFFPVPRPLQQVRRAGSLKPICPHLSYKSLLAELDQVTRRIKHTIAQIKVRGVVDASLEPALAQLELASDGQYAVAASGEQLGPNGVKIADLVAHWPLDEPIKALAGLYQQREMIKQAIYEVTGLSDIIRGATNASETATAQSIKARWGTQRIQRMQAEVARFARDLFRLKAEVILNLFSWATIKETTRMRFTPSEAPEASQIGHNGGPPMDAEPSAGIGGIGGIGGGGGLQGPAHEAMPADLEEDVREVLQSAKARAYLIDIETDSTIRADMSRDQEQMNMFLQGTAQFVQALGSAGQIMPQIVPHLVALYTAFAGKFKLGKQAEDALEAMMLAGKKGVPGGPSPEDVAGLQQQLEAAMGEVQRLTAELQAADVDLKKHGMALQNAQQVESMRLDGAARIKAMELDASERQDVRKQQFEAMRAGVPIQTKAMDLEHATVENDKDRAAELERVAYEAALRPKPSEAGATP